MALPNANATTPSAQKTDDLRRSIRDYLATHNVMTIASCDGNVPWAAAVFYASDGFDLYFFSNPRSRHGINMTANATVSAAIHEDYRDWREIRGLQLEGRAERLRSLKLQARFLEVFSKKFPFVKEFFRPGTLRQLLQPKLAGIRLYRIVPHTIYYLDNRRGFGHREMLEVSNPSRARQQAVPER